REPRFLRGTLDSGPSTVDGPGDFAGTLGDQAIDPATLARRGCDVRRSLDIEDVGDTAAGTRHLFGANGLGPVLGAFVASVGQAKLNDD
ncbi:MAG: hypothetical protein JW889_00105, partial [Verrucomicrobia bacterium]|nr:hypothetical protein [Verrucomicrobiota bacterium]